MERVRDRTHGEGARARILVVDDDSTTVDLVRSVLEANGYACFTASGGEQALAIVAANPDILIAICDINMPGMDGISFLKRLSGSGGMCSPRVLFLTAYPRVDYAVAALRLGAIDFLTKPVRPQQLLTAVRDAVVRVERERAISHLPDQAATLAQQAQRLAAALKDLAEASPAPERAAASAAPDRAPARETTPVHPGEFALLGMDHLRRLRRQFPPLGDIDDVAWDLLRELLLAEKSGQRLSVSALSMSVEQVSSTTALRRIQEMVKAGHIIRTPDPLDARRDFVALSPGVRVALEQYLERVARELAAAAGSPP